ncbi:MAG: hypothetical protein K0Q49_2120 [Haloplasmataceae bacterium]|jgi:hypothetical protein|nr:hypothetical protein [Haloplasmataceae bacterium]
MDNLINFVVGDLVVSADLIVTIKVIVVLAVLECISLIAKTLLRGVR